MPPHPEIDDARPAETAEQSAVEWTDGRLDPDPPKVWLMMGHRAGDNTQVLASWAFFKGIQGGVRLSLGRAAASAQVDDEVLGGPAPPRGQVGQPHVVPALRGVFALRHAARRPADRA